MVYFDNLCVNTFHLLHINIIRGQVPFGLLSDLLVFKIYRLNQNVSGEIVKGWNWVLFERSKQVVSIHHLANT